jgi:hypothetical protein
MEGEFEAMLSEYWDAAYAEGAECRTHDTKDGRAQHALSALREHCEALRARLAEVEAQLDIATSALKVLSCLGNGERPGNSIGNTIAQEALAKLEEK